MWEKESQFWYILRFGIFFSKILMLVTEASGDTVTDFQKSEENEMKGRIVGGKPASIETFPSAVILTNMGAQCSGTILTNHAVLTAAHCFMFNDDTDDMLIQVGSRYRNDHTSIMHRVAYVVIHEDFNVSMQFACDIAVVFVKTPIRFGPKAKKAVIVNNNYWMSRKQRNFTVTGWGQIMYDGTTSKSLLMAQLRYIPKRECESYHKLNFTEDMFCLYGDAKRDTCKGDSGGGVLWQDQLVGIVSHGDGCAQRDKPSVYSNVWYFRDWINNTLTNFYDSYYCKYILPRLKRKRNHSTGLDVTFK